MFSHLVRNISPIIPNHRKYISNWRHIMKLTKVFEHGKIGNLELKNRLVVSAMSSHMGNPDGTPNEAVNAYLVGGSVGVAHMR